MSSIWWWRFSIELKVGKLFALWNRMVCTVRLGGLRVFWVNFCPKIVYVMRSVIYNFAWIWSLIFVCDLKCDWQVFMNLESAFSSNWVCIMHSVIGMFAWVWSSLFVRTECVWCKEWLAGLYISIIKYINIRIYQYSFVSIFQNLNFPISQYSSIDRIDVYLATDTIQ